MAALFYFLMLAVCGVSCTTNDVVDEGGTTEKDLYEIKDVALGEYLVYNCTRDDENKLPFETAIVQDGKYFLDKNKAATVESLYLVKNDTQVGVLEEAGLATAAQKIVDMDGLQFFTSLKSLKLTSNLIEKMDLTALSQLQEVEMNNNMMSSIDLSGNTELVRFRFGANSEADASHKLSSISFAHNTKIEHIYLKGQNLQEGGFVLPTDYSQLKELDLSENPAAPFTIPEDLMAQLTTAKGVEVSGEDPGDGGDDNTDIGEGFYYIKDMAFGEYMEYLSGQGELPEGIVVLNEGKYYLDIEKAAGVTELNVSKTSSSQEELASAGLETANVLINSVDGLQYFTSLVSFTATSNKFMEQLPLQNLTNLEILQVNTSGISFLDVSHNTKLRILNCNGSTKTDYGILTAVDLSHNTELEELNLKNNYLRTISLDGMLKLKEVDLSGNPGADFVIPAEIYNNLTSKKGVVSE